MRVFKGKVFARWAKSERIEDEVLCKAAQEAFAGQVEADLGLHLFKKRVARTGGGKSGGYRTILGFRKNNSKRIFFLFGFPKSAKANLSSKEKKALGVLAVSLIDTTDPQIDALKADGTIEELECRK
ncbi:hypothetical protein SAMN05444007_11910 [Cribrihabitans marinus]|uniref:RelE toxin of RelE / RelB toxin-antitoxin system n=1 Tax=Cribrihabitans marinus TaxID=1227549 RepID=A0A1H7E5T4_9RHOB|nr:type II toxin-antitoxin system RelE/ParE family toxin [Cribrihabitans marinus]GGH41431.1 hypothetical protein GCM10010973_38370 [Cribrihabitans marinus]SEK07432.1 hypothetical protein SAMN05444007_11910 [Cribrihabitans marinus]